MLYKYLLITLPQNPPIICIPKRSVYIQKPMVLASPSFHQEDLSPNIGTRIKLSRNSFFLYISEIKYIFSTLLFHIYK